MTIVFCEDLYRPAHSALQRLVTANPNLGFDPWSLDSAKTAHGPAVRGPAVRGPVVKATHDFDKLHPKVNPLLLSV